MKNCPIANENATCGLHSPETKRTDIPVPAVAYCKECSQIAFQCADGHWNRAFARFCTKCGKELKKPATWEMASANPQRTAILSQEASTDSLAINYRTGSWSAGIPEIEPREDLPKLLAIDGLIIIPNTSSRTLDAYSIVKPENARHLETQWSIEINSPLTQGSTPIYHGLHLYCVVSGGIQKTNVFGGETEFININGVDAAKIKPTPTCAPLKLNLEDSPTLVAGLDQGMLLFDLDTHNAVYIEHKFFEEKNGPMSAVLCGTHIVFTSLTGQIFTLNIREKPYKSRLSRWKNNSFSTPVIVGNSVYFEALDNAGNRKLASYDPISDNLSKVGNLGTDKELKRRFLLFSHPTLTDGKRLFLSDTFGQSIHTYNIRLKNWTHKNLIAEGNHNPLFYPHRSVMVNSRIYSVHSAGLTILSTVQNYAGLSHSLAMGQVDKPFPVAPPIRYGNILFVLCRDRLVCLNYLEYIQ